MLKQKYNQQWDMTMTELYDELLQRARQASNKYDFKRLTNDLADSFNRDISSQNVAKILSVMMERPFFRKNKTETTDEMYAAINLHKERAVEVGLPMSWLVYEASDYTFSKNLGYSLNHYCRQEEENVATVLSFFEKSAEKDYGATLNHVSEMFDRIVPLNLSEAEQQRIFSLLDKMPSALENGAAASDYVLMAVYAYRIKPSDKALQYMERAAAMPGTQREDCRELIRLCTDLVDEDAENNENIVDKAGSALKIMREIAGHGYQLDTYLKRVFDEMTVDAVPALSREMQFLAARLVECPAKESLFDYTFKVVQKLMDKAPADEQKNLAETSLKMIEDLQAVPYRPKKQFELFSICREVVRKRPDLAARCLNVVEAETKRPLLAKNVSSLSDFYGETVFDSGIYKEKTIRNVSELFSRSEMGVADYAYTGLLLNKGSAETAVEILENKINAWAAAGFAVDAEKEEDRAETSWWECLANVMSSIANDEDKKSVAEKIVQLEKLLVQSPKALGDTSYDYRHLSSICSDLLGNYPELVGEHFQVWEDFCRNHPTVDSKQMLNILQNFGYENPQESKRILQLTSLLKMPEDPNGAAEIYPVLQSIGCNLNVADGILKIINESGLCPEKMLGVEEFTENEQNALLIKNSLENYKSLMLSSSEMSPELLVKIETAANLADKFKLYGENGIVPESKKNYWREELSEVKQKYDCLSEGEKNRLNRLLTTKQLSRFERNYFIGRGIEFCAECNLGNYLKIRDYMLQQANAESDDATVMGWLVPSAAACEKLYGKDYMKYFQVIENYNKTLSTLQKNKSLNDYVRQRKIQLLKNEYNGYEYINDTLKKLPDNRLLVKIALQKNLLLYPPEEVGISEVIKKWQKEVLSDKNFDINKERRRVGLHMQSVLGTMFDTVNYIDYEKLKPIGTEQSTAWMVKAMNGDIRHIKKIRGFADRYLKATNGSGQPFLRIVAPHYAAQRLNSLDDIERAPMTFSDDFACLADRLKYLSDKELASLKYNEIYERLSSMEFAGRSVEFARTNSGYLSSQEEYSQAEEIYLKGCVTPSRFADKPVLYNEDKTLRCKVAEKDDPRILFVGKHTSCCQSFGDVGSSCAVDSIINPHSGCMIWESRNSDKEEWEICGCSWFYESQNGKYKGLTFDNVEVNNYCHRNEEVKQLLDKMVEQFAGDNYRYISIGESREDINTHSCPKLGVSNPLPQGYGTGGYSDAGKQRILFDNPAAVPEQINDLTIVPGTRNEQTDCEKLVENLEQVVEDGNGKFIVMKDDRQIYGLAAWNCESGQAVVSLFPKCADKVPQRAQAFLKHAMACINRDIQNPRGPEGNWAQYVSSTAEPAKKNMPRRETVGAEYE